MGHVEHVLAVQQREESFSQDNSPYISLSHSLLSCSRSTQTDLLTLATLEDQQLTELETNRIKRERERERATHPKRMPEMQQNNCHSKTYKDISITSVCYHNNPFAPQTIHSNDSHSATLVPRRSKLRGGGEEKFNRANEQSSYRSLRRQCT